MSDDEAMDDAFIEGTGGDPRAESAPTSLCVDMLASRDGIRGKVHLCLSVGHGTGADVLTDAHVVLDACCLPPAIAAAIRNDRDAEEALKIDLVHDAVGRFLMRDHRIDWQRREQRRWS